MFDGITQVILWLGGIQAVFTAILGYIGKLWIDRLKEKQKGEINADRARIRADLDATNLQLKSALDRKLHVHKLQFQKEQQVYESIWSMLVDLQKAVGQLRPILDHCDPNETEKERKQRRLSAVVDPFNSFLDQVNKERPFYSKEVYGELQELRSLMHRETTEYRILDPHDEDYWLRARENAEAISNKIDSVCESIRNRIRAISAT